MISEKEFKSLALDYTCDYRDLGSLGNTELVHIADRLEEIKQRFEAIDDFADSITQRGEIEIKPESVAGRTVCYKLHFRNQNYPTVIYPVATVEGEFINSLNIANFLGNSLQDTKHLLERIKTLEDYVRVLEIETLDYRLKERQ